MMVTSSPTRRTIFKRKCFLIVYVTHYYYYLQTCAIWGKAAGPAWRQAGRLPSLCHQSDLSALRISERILLSPCTQDTGVLQGPRCYAKFNFSNCWINHLLILLLAPLFRRCVQKTSPHNSGKWPFVISQGGLWCTKSESICAFLGRLVPLLLRLDSQWGLWFQTILAWQQDASRAENTSCSYRVEKQPHWGALRQQRKTVV